MFPRAEACVYLDTAAEGLPPEGTEDALAAYCRDKSAGSAGRARLEEEEAEASEVMARMLGATAEDVTFLGSASEGLNLLANSLSWQPGDEVLTTDLEFPSGVLAWLRLRERGVGLRVIRSENGAVSAEQIFAAIGPSTRVVCLSHVSYKTGTLLPFLSEIGREAQRAGAILCVDATQALGRTPVSVDGIDFLVASGYKWLLGIHGLGVAYLSPSLRERMTPATVGWYSVTDLFRRDRFKRYRLKEGAGRLVSGMPNFPAIYTLSRSAELLLEIGVEKLDCHLRPLVRSMREGIAQLGFEVLTPSAPEYASGIVSFAHPEPHRIGGALEKEGVIVWSGDKRVRASIHLYNDELDVARFLEALGAVLTRQLSGGGSSANEKLSGGQRRNVD
jgi:selenocysteine lyase/cysteine desulfurase